VNGTLFFSADDGIHGESLWKSDGTPGGTVMVKNINPGPGDSKPTNLTNMKGTLFFVARDGVHGSELWMSDGTKKGTVMVKDIKPGSKGSALRLVDTLKPVNGTLFFDAADKTHGYELWAYKP
jgi:ELWxxDGT repeat protein